MIQARQVAVILIAACLAGTATEATAAEPHGRAYLFRGMIDLIDWGMDQLAGRINRTGNASFNLKNRSEVIHVNLDKFPHIQEILASKIRSAGATSEGREPLRLVVPPSVPIELWDSGLAVSAHAGDTLQTIATTYHVPLWTLTQLNKALETAALTEGQRVVIPHSVGQKIPSSPAQNPVSSDATPAGN